VDGATLRPSGGGVDVQFVLTRARTTRLRARQVTDDEPPAVLVTPRLAELAGGVGGTLPLRVGGAVVPARVAGVVERFPGTTGDLAVGARAALRTAINAAAPGGARENEAWLDYPERETGRVLDALAEPPFHVLSVTARAELERQARSDPLARGTLAALSAAALLALLLAAVGLALAVRADLRDERGELVDLEAQGLPPSLLRRVVRSRAAALSVAGLLAGVATGALLLSLVTRVVAVTARGGFAEPPLVATVDLVVLAAGVAVYVLVAAALVGVATRRAFSDPRGPLDREYA
jgi:putative ABC transport system permease protein